MDRLRRRLAELAGAEPGPAEVLAGLLAAAWSIVLGLPGDTFGSSPSYAVMQAIAPAPVWAALFAGLAALQLGGVLLEKRRARRLGSLAAVGLWGLVAFMLGLANPASTGPWCYALVAGSSACAYWRLAVRQ